MNESVDRKSTSEHQRRITVLKNKRREIEAEMSKLQGLPSMSQLRDELIEVDKEIAAFTQENDM